MVTGRPVRQPAIVAVGDFCVDYYESHRRLFPGGQAFNVSVHARRLGLTAALASCVGTDFWGSWLLDKAAVAGVECSLSERLAGRSFVTTVRHVGGFEREFISEEEGATAGWAVADEVLARAARARLVYVTPWARAGSRLGILRSTRGPLVAFDCMDLAGEAPLPAELRFVDIAFVPLAGGDEIALVRRIAEQGVRFVVVSRGGDGSAVYASDRLVSFRPASPTTVVDTLGAGDALAAAFCIAYLRSGDIGLAHERAADYAARTCAHFGGTLGPRGEWDSPLSRRRQPGTGRSRASSENLHGRRSAATTLREQDV